MTTQRIVYGADPYIWLAQCAHCGMRIRGKLVVVSPRMPWGFWECEDKLACRLRRAQRLERGIARVCPLCGADDWLVGGHDPDMPLRCMDMDRCRDVRMMTLGAAHSIGD